MPKSVAEADDGGLYEPRISRRGIATHYYNDETRQALQDQCDDGGTCCGIYELKVVKGETEAVVYIGSTHREPPVMSLYQRLSEYMKDGSHIKKIIQRALNQGFAIHARWIKLSQDLCDKKCKENGINIAEELENRYLKQFDYAWNTRGNDTRRQIHDISVQT